MLLPLKRWRQIVLASWKTWPRKTFPITLKICVDISHPNVGFSLFIGIYLLFQKRRVFSQCFFGFLMSSMNTNLSKIIIKSDLKDKSRTTLSSSFWYSLDRPTQIHSFSTLWLFAVSSYGVETNLLKCQYTRKVFCWGGRWSLRELP